VTDTLTAHVWLIVNGCIKEAECPVCLDSPPVSDLSGSKDEQLAQLQAMFDRHLRMRHADLLNAA
jgi:hypothetical protein